MPTGFELRDRQQFNRDLRHGTVTALALWEQRQRQQEPHMPFPQAKPEDTYQGTGPNRAPADNPTPVPITPSSENMALLVDAIAALRVRVEKLEEQMKESNT